MREAQKRVGFDSPWVRRVLLSTHLASFDQTTISFTLLSSRPENLTLRKPSRPSLPRMYPYAGLRTNVPFWILNETYPRDVHQGIRPPFPTLTVDPRVPLWDFLARPLDEIAD
jgi:hypothetical protein